MMPACVSAERRASSSAGGGWRQQCHGLTPHDGIARFDGNPLQLPCNRRGHNENIVDARASFINDVMLDDAPIDDRGFYGHGSGPHQPQKASQKHDARAQPKEMA
jgi:hypothetical protein